MMHRGGATSSSEGRAGTPRVSVIVPCFEHAGVLAECLASLGRQTTADWEAIVVDDGSAASDPAPVIEQAADPRIRLVRHGRNRGLSAARNTGLRESRAAFVVPVDADDVLEPTFLDALASALEENAAADCAFSDFRHFGTEGHVHRNAVRDARAMTLGQWMPGAGTMMRRELWERVGGYSEVPELRAGNEDWDFWLSATELGFTPVHVPEPLYLYRRAQGSLSDLLKHDDLATREVLLSRHRGLFARCRTAGRFLATGHLNAAAAHWHRGGRVAATGAWSRALRLSPRVALAEPAGRALRRVLGPLVRVARYNPGAR
jgi:glycosyltransferase involved in cell wall biosynthesis